MFDYSTLAGGVHALQYQQDRAPIARQTIGVQLLLQFGVDGVALGLQFGGVGLLAAKPRRRTGVQVRDQIAGLELQMMVRLMGPQLGQIGGHPSY